ncbi:MAG: CHAT domain-containing tetratricopeptide repeat protein [Fulvivirga sp.]
MKFVLLATTFSLISAYAIGQSSPSALLKLANEKKDQSLYDSAATIASQQGDSIVLLSALAAWGDLLLRQRNPSGVIQRFDSIDFMGYETKTKHLYDFLKVYNKAHGMLDHHQSVLETSKILLRLNQQLFDELNADRVDFTYYVGMMQANLFIRDKGLENLKKALGLSIKLNGEKSERTAVLYNNIGITYKSMGDFKNAITYYEKTIDLLEDFDPDNYGALATITNNISGVYMERGLYEKALEVNQEALNFVAKSGRNNPSINIKRGQIYLEMDNAADALKNFQKALSLLKELVPAGHPAIWLVSHEVGTAHFELENYDSANYYFESILSAEAVASSEASPDVFLAFVGKGKVASAMDNYDQALIHFDEAIKYILPEYVEGNEVVPTLDFVPFDYLGLMVNNVLLEKGKTLHAKGLDNNKPETLEKALAYFQKGIDIYSKQINAATSESQQLGLSQDKQANYKEAISVCYDLYRLTNDEQYISRAHNIIESNKAIILYRNLTKARSLDIPDSLQIAISNIKLQIDDNRRKYRSLLHAKADSEANVLRDSIISQQLVLENLNKTIRNDFASYFENSLDIDMASLSEVRNNLPNKTSLIQYFESSDTSYYAIAISKSAYSFKLINLDNEISRDLISMQNRDNQRARSIALYQKLVAPFEPQIQNNNSLIIMPDGKTGVVPFELLTLLENNKPTYLIEKYRISYHYSANLLNLSQKNSLEKANSKSVLAYAPTFNNTTNTLLATRTAEDSSLVSELINLPQAQTEAAQIAKMLSGELRQGAVATESDFKMYAKDYNILHLATHAMINNENPLQSRLVMSQESDSLNDGLLHTYELYNMKLNANLVALSACNTGVGKYYKGEGVMSLARGFMYAGVPNVMMSLWSVPDASTSEIMQSFYQHLKNGKSKPEALRQAKLDYLAKADENTSNPYYWAGFVYIGSPEMDNSNSKLWMVLGAAVIVIVIVAGIRRKKKSQNG